MPAKNRVGLLASQWGAWPATVLAVAWIVVTAPAAGGTGLRAEQISEATVDALQIGGADAVGGVGDWYLANDLVEVIVDDPGRRYAALNHGGTIVDAGRRALRGEDQFARLWPLVNLDQRVVIGFDRIEAHVDAAGGEASLRVWNEGGMWPVKRGGLLARSFDPLVPDASELSSVHVETVYRVRPGEPFVRIETTLRNEGDEPAPIFSYGDVWMRGGRSIRSWVGNALEPLRSPGFHHQSFDRANILGASEAFAAFTHVSAPGLRGRPPIAYAIYAPERASRGHLQFGVTGWHITFVNAFTADPDWSSLGLWRLLRATRDTLAPGAAWTFERRLLIVDRRSVSATTDVIFPALGLTDGASGIVGRVEPPHVPVGIEVEDARSGAPVTHVQPAETGPDAGRIDAALPPGDYTLTIQAPHRAPSSRSISVGAGSRTDLGVVSLAPTGRLRFGRAFADGGGGRVIVLGVGETADPVFAPELIDFRLDGRHGKSGSETRELHFLGNRHDPVEVEIAAGEYRLVATRGLEFDLAEQRVSVASGRTTRVAPIALSRVIETPDYITADFHVHGDASSDSGIAQAARLRSFLAEGVDAFVATDHDNVGSYEAALAALGNPDRILIVPGVEVTGSAPSEAAPWTNGHHNAWPIERAPHLHRGGAPPSQGFDVGGLYAQLRRHAVRVIQLNHPRPREGELDDGSYFSHLGAAGVAYRPDQPLAASPNARLLEPTPGGTTRPIDFDAIEVINGEPYGQHPWELMRADWYSLLRQCTETRTGSRPAIAISPIPTPPTRNRVINGPVVPNRRPPSTAASRVSGVSAARRKAT